MYFDTNSVRSARRQDAWLEAIDGQCGAFDIDFGAQDFEGSIDVRQVGRFRCARIMQSTRRTSRLEQQLDRRQSPLYYVLLQIAGRSRIEQFGRSAVMDAGDITILDANAPMSFEYDRKTIQLSLHIPKADLDDRRPEWRGLVASNMSRARGVLINSLICSAYHSGNVIEQTQADVISDAIIGLLAVAWNPTADCALSLPPASSQTQVLIAVQNYIIAHLQDEFLAPQKIARENGLSERQLHRIFHASGQSLCHWIRQSRLDRCAADLRDPHKHGRTITEIAFRWGFNDSAHFSRVFRAEFGESPRMYRATASARH